MICFFSILNQFLPIQAFGIEEILSLISLSSSLFIKTAGLPPYLTAQETAAPAEPVNSDPR